MTLGASLIGRRLNIDAAAVFRVAGGALEILGFHQMVRRAVVAGQARAVLGLGGKNAGLLQVAGGAFPFEDGVSGAHASAGVDARVFGETAPADPGDRDERKKQAEPKFRTLVLRRPLEIVEVDALGELFSCACAWHVF